MRTYVTLLFTSVCSLALLLQPANADERAQVKEKIEAMLREVKQLKEAGKHDEAKALHDKAEALIREIKGGDKERRDAPVIGREQLERGEQEIAKRRAHAAELRKAGKVDEAERVEQETKALAEKLSRAAQEFKRRAEAGDNQRDQPREGARREGAPREEARPERARRDEPRREGAPREEGRPERGQRDEPRREGAPREDARPERGQRDEPRRDAPPREGARREGAPRDAGPDRDEVRELREQVRRMHAELEELKNLVRRLAERREER